MSERAQRKKASHQEGFAMALTLLGALAVAGLGALTVIHGLERLAVGVLLALVVAGTLIVERHQLAGGFRVAAGACLLIAGVGVVFAISGWHEHVESNAKSEVRRVIDQAARAETAWYQYPQSDGGKIRTYYPPKSHGLARIEVVVTHLRGERCHWTSEAYQLPDVRSITILGQRAIAHSIEYYHQPLACMSTANGAKDSSAQVTYELEKRNGRWRIIATTAGFLLR
jgi:hypothetical protein